MKIKLFFITCIQLFLTVISLGQGIYTVNPVTGTGSAAIPLYNLNYGGISVPVEVVYSAPGVKPKDVEGTAGMDWQLVAGGEVSRVVRGLPDDACQTNDGPGRIGWMYNSNQSAISAFGISNNGSACSNETADLNYITGHFGNLSDTEPDLFNVSAPGLSCTLVYDHAINNFRTVPYQDLKIAYTINTDSVITSFTIINDKGTIYQFAQAEAARQYTNNKTTSLNYFANFYNQYLSVISYNDGWFLTSMADANGQGANFYYTSATVRSGSDPVRLYIGGSNSPTVEYNVISSVWPELLSSISFGDNDVYTTAVSFTWNDGASSTGQPYISSISGRNRTINFSYKFETYPIDGANFTKSFLGSISETGCSSPVNYHFSYVGETVVSQVSNDYNTTLSDSSSKKFDYWGYNNSVKDSIPKLYVNPSDTSYQTYAVCAGITPGSNYPYTVGMSLASVDSVAVQAGSLDTVKYATGGMTTITYQSNDYVDIPSGTVVKGGGIRVEQVVDHDGMNEAKDIIRNYSYTNPATGLSSGKPTSLPSYGFTIPYSGSATGQTLWTDATAVSDADLSQEDHTIMYSYVKESQTHAGSTVYQYVLPGANWDKTAVPDCTGCTTIDWRPTTDYSGRTSCTGTYGPVKNYTNSYPFLPNINYDFERGLPLSVINYTDAVTKVSESDYTYSRSYGAATAIPALHYDYNGGTSGVMGYGKYNIYTTTSELTAKVVNTVYDSPTLSQAQTSTVNYVYGSANHKLLTQQSTTNSDGTVLINNIKYTKDYAATASTNANINALYYLVQRNVNAPVETWSQVQYGGTTYTTAATLNLFSNFTNYALGTVYLPGQLFKLTLPNGETSFTPFSFSGTTITKDAGYQPLPVNFDSYDNDATLMTSDDSRHHEQTTMTDHVLEKPILTATNAAYNELAFDNFDSYLLNPYNYFSVSGTSTYTTPGHTGMAASFSTSQTLTSFTVNRNVQANNYIFSIWINSGSIVGNMTLTLALNIGGTVNTYTKTFTAPGNNWQYYEWKLPVSGTSFIVSMTSSANIFIDDALFYPETSEVSTYSYDPVSHLPTSATNTNGISTYYTYDQWGRLQYTFDRYKNILQKNTFVSNSDEAAFQALSLSANFYTVYRDTAIILKVPLSGCVTGLNCTYHWNFGDGTTFNTNAPISPGHSYDSIKTYHPTVQVMSPLYGNTVLSTTVNVVIPSPTSVPLSFTNNTGSGNADISSLQFYQGSTLYATYSPTQISTGHVLSGSYTVKVVMSAKAAGYGSIQINVGGSLYACSNYVSSGNYTFTFNVALPLNCTGMQLLENAAACSGGGGPE